MASAYQWDLRGALRGRTAAQALAPLPAPGGGAAALLVSASSSARAGFRVVLAPARFAGAPPLETCLGPSAGADVFCVAVVSEEGGGAARVALGFGIGDAPDVDAPDFRGCPLPPPPPGGPVGDLDLWLLVDAESGWVVLGAGRDPRAGDSLLLSLKLFAGDARLRALTHLTASSWEAPLTVRATALAEPAGAALCGLAFFGSVGSKFDLQGAVAPFPGVTTVCAAPAGGPLHTLMLRVREALCGEPLLRGLFTALPPSSYHMTVMDLLAGRFFLERAHRLAEKIGSEGADPGAAGAGAADVGAGSAPPPPPPLASLEIESAGWDRVEPLARPLVAALAERITDSAIGDSRAQTAFAMRVVGADATHVWLEPCDAEAAAALSAWRRAVAARLRPLLGLDPDANGGHYRFHATIAYQHFPAGLSEEVAAARRRVDAAAARGAAELAAAGPLIVRAPALCFFADMACFYAVEARRRRE